MACAEPAPVTQLKAVAAKTMAAEEMMFFMRRRVLDGVGVSVFLDFFTVFWQAASLHPPIGGKAVMYCGFVMAWVGSSIVCWPEH